jgi:hypothetical protein
MHGIESIAGELFEQAICDHRLGAADAFFRRLEYEVYLAAKILAAGKILGRRQ